MLIAARLLALGLRSLPSVAIGAGGIGLLPDLKAQHGAAGIEPHATANRDKLAAVMERNGFKRYAEEWWHCTLVNEPFPDTYFEFPVTAAAPSP